MKQKSESMLFSDRDILLLIVPLVIELGLELIVGLLDSVMVASVGEAAVSGVSLVDSVIQLLIYIFAALASGGAIVAGQYLGAGRKQAAREAAEELLWLNALLSFGIMLLSLFFLRFILSHLFGAIDADVYEQAYQYFLVVAFSIPAIGIFESGTAIFRTMSDSRTTMKISLMMNVINGIGNGILIYGFDMGTRGAAIATLASRWSAAVVIVLLLLDPKRELHLNRSFRHRFQPELSKKICSLGIPGGVENGIFQLGKIVILGLVTSFGVSAITANAVTQKLASLEMIPGSAVQLAVVPIIARCIGAGSSRQAIYYNRKLLKISYAAVFVWSLLLVLCLSPILSLYRLSADTAALTASMFLWHALGAVLLWPLAFDLPASLRASGDVRFPMVTSIISMWIFRYGGAYLLSKIMGIGVIGVWISMSILDWGFRAALYLIRWKSGIWIRKSITNQKIHSNR